MKAPVVTCITEYNNFFTRVMKLFWYFFHLASVHDRYKLAHIRFCPRSLLLISANDLGRLSTLSAGAGFGSFLWNEVELSIGEKS